MPEPQPYRAVVTTGIYCREGCGASPRDDHVRPFDFAAAAEANGFRPCLRCRPDRLPGPSWVGSSELVCRALRLVADGALDGAGEDQLAARLGVSARHLRRLFADHVGATPDTVARSRRAHLARRLLDETDLRVADIAFAAGFTSVRQMNRVVRDTFRLTPSELRARRRKADRLVADGGLDLRLPFRAPLAWDALLGFLAARAIPGVESVDGGGYRRTVRIDGHPGVLELRLAGEGEGRGDHVRLRAHLPSWAGLAHVVAGARRIFDLDAEPGTVAAALEHDPWLAARAGQLPGVRVPGAWEGFEVAVRAVLGQQVSVAGATTLSGRLVERFGDPVDGLGPLGLRAVFPDPGRLAETSIGDVAAIGLPRARAATIVELSQRVAGGQLVLDRGQGLDRLVGELLDVPGIGPWTAHYVAMRAGGEPDAFPAGDLGLRRALGCSPAELAERAAAWRPWRAYAAMLVWLTPGNG